MIGVILRGLATRKLRAALTALAIVLGVAMISGTYVLMDTTMHAFDNLFTTAYAKAGAVVVGRTPITGTHSGAPPVPAALAARIRALPQVKDAQGYIDDKAQIRDAKGAAINGPGSPIALSVPAAGSTLNTLQLVSGHFPNGPGQIALDEQTASTNHFRLGSRIGVAARHPLQWFRVVGLVRFGGAQSLGPMQLLVFDLPVAQQLFDKHGLYDEIDVSARPGVSSRQLVRAIAPLLPPAAQVKTGAKQVQETTQHVEEGMAIVRYVLLAFGAIALFVGAFVIFNTLSVTVAQRTRELAILRTLGASRGQVLASVVLEALVIGALASLIGLVAGLGLARALESMFAAMGMQLPNAGTVFARHTVIVSLAAGIAVTLLASVPPAMRATRVAPIAAVREGATLPPSRFAHAKSLVASAAGVAGAGLLSTGLFAGGLATSVRLILLAAGAAVVFVCLAFLSRWLVAPLATALGRPFEAITGAAGMLARENSARNPARTAVTAGALTVGLALVAFIATLGAGLRGTITDSIKQQIHADYVISANNAPLPPAAGNVLRATPGVAASSVREGQIVAFGAAEQMNGVDPNTITRFYRFKWTPGSGPSALAQLSGSGAIVSKRFASAHHLAIGSRFRVDTQSAVKLTLTVRGIQTLPTFGALLGAVTISTALFDHSFVQPSDAAILASTGGATPAAQQSLANLLRNFPSAKVRTTNAYITTSRASIDTLLNLFYVLLALSVIVSLFGIVNTLALTIVERTREIGALRAIGMTRRQLTRMIRIESEITAVIGAAIGISVGLALAGLATAGLATWNVSFTVPWTTLLALATVAFLAGMAAGVFPARRAAHLDPLQALHYE